MSQENNGRDAVRQWRKTQDVTLADLSVEIGDLGGQLQRWESGERQTLPLKFKVRLSQRTGIPLDQLTDPEERELAKDLVLIMARDGAAA